MQALAVARSLVVAAMAVTDSAGEGAREGGVYGAIIQGAIAAGEMATLVAMVAAGSSPKPPSFQTGYNPESYGRGVDSTLAYINPNEPIISAPKYQRNKDTIDSIQNNTYNNRSNGSSPVIIQYYSVTTEQMLQSQVTAGRTNRTGLRT